MARSGLCVGCGTCARRDARGTRDGFLKPEATHGPRRTVVRAHLPLLAGRSERRCDRRRTLSGSASPRRPRIGRFEAAYVGHASKTRFRRNGSSGGLTSWVAAELLRTGAGRRRRACRAGRSGNAAVCFAYRISRSLDELSAGAKSRYYPVELSQVLARNPRRRPAATRSLASPASSRRSISSAASIPSISERVTHTLGLFCGHMKSAAMVESFAWQLGTELRAGPRARLSHQGREPPGQLVPRAPRPR